MSHCKINDELFSLAMQARVKSDRGELQFTPSALRAWLAHVRTCITCRYWQKWSVLKHRKELR